MLVRKKLKRRIQRLLKNEVMTKNQIIKKTLIKRKMETRERLMKLKLVLYIVLMGLVFKANGQVAHPPQNRGAEGMYYWNESLQKYVRAEEAQINYRQYLSKFPNGNIDVINYLTGKTFTKQSNGTGRDFTSILFVGMDAMSNNPFNHNPYPNATDYAGAPWDFPQNRLRMIWRTDNNIERTFFVWNVEFQPNGAAILSYFQEGENFNNNTVAQAGYISTSKFYLFKQDASQNRGLEAYLGGLPNGMLRLENDFVYNINGTNSSSTGTMVDANCIMSFTPVVNTVGGVKLSDVIVFDSYKLEGNSSLTFDKLGNKSYKFEVISQKIFGIGKEKSRKGTWSVSPSSKSITFKFDDGGEKTFLVTKIGEGYMTEFKDSSGAAFQLTKVQSN